VDFPTLLIGVLDMNATTNSVVEVTVSEQDLLGFKANGSAFGESELTADGALFDFTKRVCPNGGTTANWYVLEAGAKSWKAGYAEVKSIPLTGDDGKENNTVTKAYSRFLAQCCDKYGLIKPTKPTTTAEQKKAQRSKAQIAQDELKAKPMDELLAEVQMLSAKPTLENLDKARKIQKAVESKRKDLLADRMDGIKAKQKEVKDLVGNCMDESKLDMVLDILMDNVDVAIM
jgi:hypothetical protein